MSKFSIIFIASLVILGGLLVFTVFRPMAAGEKFSALTQESIIQGEDEWIIQVSIINREGLATNYIIEWSTGGELYSRQVVCIENGRTFTNMHHVYPDTVKEGKIQLTIYKAGETTPFEESTYHIHFD